MSSTSHSRINQADNEGNRSVTHPGKREWPAVLLGEAESGKEIRFELTPGASLTEGVSAAFCSVGLPSGAVTLFGGVLDPATYLIAGPDPTERLVVAYGAPIMLKRASLVRIDGTFGPGADGQPHLHCHGSVIDHVGRVHGGHIDPKATFVGSRGVRGYATGITLGRFEIRADPETLYPLFRPV